MDKYGLIGYPLGHSFSRGFFNSKFAEEGIKAEYLNFEIPSIDYLPNIIHENPELRGFNVTIPYKEQIIPHLDELSPEAQAIGAVNVVKVVHEVGGNMRLVGYNSDIIGFMDSIRPLLGQQHRQALILGTGGASKAIYQGLKKLGIEPTFVSRRPSEKGLTYEQLTSEVMETHRVIVNCSPLGMYPRVETYPNIPYDQLTESHILYDLVYNPEVTRFMQEGAAHHAVVKNGLEMLHRQALAAWEIWNQ